MTAHLTVRLRHHPSDVTLVGAVATIIVFGSAMLVKEAWTLL
jgi:hypothetical protein